MSGVIVNYNNNQLTSMSSSGTKTLLTSGKYCEGNFEVVYSEPTTSSLTVTPTETAQTFNATGVYGYKPVTINGISSTYVGTNISRRDGDDINFDLNQGYIEVPSGYYSDGVPIYINTVSHPKPTIGISSTTGVVTATHQMSVGRYIPSTYSSIVTSTYNLTTQAAQTFYPSTADQTIASYRWLTGAQTIKSVTTSNLTAENIAEGVVVKVGDTNNASRITQITGTHIGGGNDFIVTLSQNAYGSLTIDKTFSEIISACKAGKKIAAYGDGSPYYTGAIDVDDEEFNFVEVYAYSFVGNNASLAIYEDNYTFTSNFSIFGSTGYYYNPDNMNATPSDVASGKRFINWAGFQVGTATGGGGYTADEIAMHTISGDISGNAITIVSCAFQSCYSLTTASFPNATSIGMSAFDSCYSLTTANFPNVTSIDNYAFQNCSALTTANFPNVIHIANYVFRSCSALTTVSFPNATSIGNYAFASCYKLLSLYLLGSSIPTLKTSVFNNTPINGYTTSTGGVYGSIFVPSSLYNSYIVATNWSTYSARIVSV